MSDDEKHLETGGRPRGADGLTTRPLAHLSDGSSMIRFLDNLSSTDTAGHLRAAAALDAQQHPHDRRPSVLCFVLLSVAHTARQATERKALTEQSHLRALSSLSCVDLSGLRSSGRLCGVSRRLRSVAGCRGSITPVRGSTTCFQMSLLPACIPCYSGRRWHLRKPPVYTGGKRPLRLGHPVVSPGPACAEQV